MSTANLSPEEKLFRLVIRDPNFWDTKGSNRPSSALFKDPRGTSVDKKDGRPDGDCTDFLITRIPNYRAIVSITVQNCIDKDIHIENDPQPETEIQPENPYHMLLKKDEETPKLSGAQAKYLANSCVIEVTHSDYEN
tara:strand:- start:149 stop:559 length:411 start_codon:yes stop_codon:yes gene_type:complete